MPKNYREFININVDVPVRLKSNGVYEARYRANGYNIEVSSKDYSQLKAKFIKKLKVEHPKPDLEDKQVVEWVEPEKPVKEVIFAKVCDDWLAVRKSLIKESTYNYYLSLFGANILPVFYDKVVKEIKQSEVQKLINKYIDEEKYRTAAKIYQTLKAVFDYAVGEEIIEKSPMRMIKAPKYEEQTGIALTIDEERKFLDLLDKSNCCDDVKYALIFLLYTGIRRSELKSARIEGGFVSVICSKTRKGFHEKRRLIPITPMLKKWLPKINLDNLHDVRPDALTQAMKRLMPKHHLHELRHTFITRCQECGVAREVVSVWAGHAADSTMTSNVYTHFSPEFMLKEGGKVEYDLSF
jgi:integrase